MFRFLFVVAALSLLSGCASSGEPKPNVTLLKWKCIDWYNGGHYAKAFARAARPAERTLDHYLRKETPQNFAIVFDIDETLLSNWGYLREGDFAILPATFALWLQREHAQALVPMREVFAKAHAYQIPIFLISGRDEAWRNETIRNLTDAGYWGWNGLYLKPAGYNDTSIIPFKSGVRKMLTEKGYDIILNVGDQQSDLAGGYARNRVKLPNPFYFIP